MRILVTGSSGHLGEALVRTLRSRGDEVASLDLLRSPYTSEVGSITDPDILARCMRGVDVVLHAATLHKPHIATHAPREFVDTNVTGTLTVLEAAHGAGARGVVFTSTTSAFGSALRPAEGEPAVWVTEDLRPVPRNIYGVTKVAAEDVCEWFHRSRGLPCIVLRTSRFFPEPDDDPARREHYDGLNLKVNEYLNRRVDIADAVDAHLLAAERLADIGFGRYIISATTPFSREHRVRLRDGAADVVRELFPGCERTYARRGWRLPTGLDRVYDNARARNELGWRPRLDFGSALERLERGEPAFSELASAVGSKGYHAGHFEDGIYPVEPGR